MKRAAKCVASWTVAVLLAIAPLAWLAPQPAGAQEREDRTLLTWEQMRAIINEASGERAQQAVLEMVPYPRVRDRAEYSATFRETDTMVRLAREYGYSQVTVESFPTQQRSWHASEAELWMVEPELRKLYDIHDVAISAMSGSETGDVTAEVVDVGSGARVEDYAGKDVAGKIVLGSAGGGVLQRFGVFERGAVGVLSYTSLRADSYPDQILSGSIAANAPQGKTPGFGWAVAPRVAREISARLARGEKVKLRSMVKSEYFPGELETVMAMIPGDGSSRQAVIISAHLYEGYIKQGANDDASGCAATLEIGRTLIRLIQQGRLPRPKRDIYFLWVPEISGTNAWLNKHTEIKQRIIADLNFDMEGIGLARSGAMWLLMRTPDTFPTYLNDVGASVLEFIASLNRERVRYRHHGYRFTLPVVAPNGSMDPFYAGVEKHYGASDHVTYMQHGIPALMFNTWPDMWYHTSQDTPDKLDPTQFKRAAVVGAASAYILAAADDAMAARVASESLARGTERMGTAQRKGLAYLADAPDAASLPAAYRDARATASHQAGVEKGVLQSVHALFSNPEEAKTRLAPIVSMVDQRAVALQAEVRSIFEMRAAQLGLPATEPAIPDLEKQAARLLVESTAPAAAGPGGAVGFAAQQAALAQLSPEDRRALQAALAKIPTHMGAEMNILLRQKKTVLEIRDFLTGEFEPLPLSDVLDYLRALEKVGRVKLVEKPEEPRPAPPAKRGRAPRKSD
jgi:hypothetical protein